eukprot:4020330-Pleurochrysis_carterae.AAC.3
MERKGGRGRGTRSAASNIRITAPTAKKFPTDVRDGGQCAALICTASNQVQVPNSLACKGFQLYEAVLCIRKVQIARIQSPRNKDHVQRERMVVE